MKAPNGFYAKYLKRPLDILCALAALVVFGWLYIIVALLVRIKLGSPVLFTQDRPGKDEKIFKLYKFRTMTDQRDEKGELLPDEIRLTDFGRFLRSTSLDEMPEAFNLIKGELSVCGPRPLLTSYLPYYTEEERVRHTVRPGLTGLAQINGRNALAWEERFKYDIYYANNVSFILDFKIILKTVLKVIKRENIASSTGHYESNFAEERKTKTAIRKSSEE